MNLAKMEMRAMLEKILAWIDNPKFAGDSVESVHGYIQAAPISAGSIFLCKLAVVSVQ
jgi:hypothetical protein